MATPKRYRPNDGASIRGWVIQICAVWRGLVLREATVTGQINQ